MSETNTLKDEEQIRESSQVSAAGLFSFTQTRYHELAVKHVRQSHPFIYYYDRTRDGAGYVGIRVGRANAWVVEGVVTIGERAEPERFAPCGSAEKVPLAGEGSERFEAIRHMITAAHPELERLLSGEISFDDANKSN